MRETRVRDRSKQSGQGRCVYLDRHTDQMLRELSGGHFSAFLRRLIIAEHARQELKKEMAERELQQA
jgi:hypothetical protein